MGAMIMGVVATTIFTTNSLTKRADDRAQFAADLSITSLSFDRDGVMATLASRARDADRRDLVRHDAGPRNHGGRRVGAVSDRRGQAGAGQRQCDADDGPQRLGVHVAVTPDRHAVHDRDDVHADGVEWRTAPEPGPARHAEIVAVMRRLHRDERGQSLAIVLSLITVLFLMGTALATHISVALSTTVANEAQAGDLNAADTGAELGMWWQRNGNCRHSAVDLRQRADASRPRWMSPVRCLAHRRRRSRSPGSSTGRFRPRRTGLFSAVAGTGLAADAGRRSHRGLLAQGHRSRWSGQQRLACDRPAAAPPSPASMFGWRRSPRPTSGSC